MSVYFSKTVAKVIFYLNNNVIINTTYYFSEN